MKKFLVPCILATSLILTGCQTTSETVLETNGETQLQVRNYQTRSFDTNDKERVLRAAISTLQDFGFIIDRADYLLGSVTATKVDGNKKVKITVVSRQKGKDKTIVRANAQFNLAPVKNPKIYQDFFSALEKSLFLSANAVD